MKKVEGKYILLAEEQFRWNHDEKINLQVELTGDTMTLTINGKAIATITDEDHPYTYGQIGLGNGWGCMTKFHTLEFEER
jgi:hypothetical protein